MDIYDDEEGITFLCIGLKTFRQLAEIARKKGRTVSQLIAGALQREILEYQASTQQKSEVDADKPA